MCIINLPVKIRTPDRGSLMPDGEPVKFLDNPKSSVALHTQVTLGVGEGHPHRFGHDRLVLQLPQAELDPVKLFHNLIKVV